MPLKDYVFVFLKIVYIVLFFMFFFARISFQVPSSSLEFCQLLPLNMGSFTIISHEAATILAASIPLILLQQQGLQCAVKS